jgi:hypothetical protein
MLGEKIGEISGKITMQRVLPSLGRVSKDGNVVSGDRRRDGEHTLEILGMEVVSATGAKF